MPNICTIIIFLKETQAVTLDQGLQRDGLDLVSQILYGNLIKKDDEFLINFKIRLTRWLSG